MWHKRWLMGLKASQPAPMENPSGSEKEAEFAGIDSGMEGGNGVDSDTPLNPIDSNDLANFSSSEASNGEGGFTGVKRGRPMESSGDADDEADEDEATPCNRSLPPGSHRAFALLLQSGRCPPPKFDLFSDLPPSSPPTSSEMECDNSPTLSLPPRHHRDSPRTMRRMGQNFPLQKTLGPLTSGGYGRSNGMQSYNKYIVHPQPRPHSPTPGSDSKWVYCCSLLGRILIFLT